MKRILSLCAGAAAGLAPFAAVADEPLIGQPTPGALDFQPTVTPVGAATAEFHTIMLWVAFVVSAFVLVLLVVTLVRFNERANPEPKRFTHHVLLEVAWTAIPAMILLALISPSLSLLYLQEEVPEADIVVKATGNQWNWSYTYDIEGADEPVIYESNMAGHGYATYDQMVEGMTEAGDADLIPSRAEWRLAATADMVVPVNAVVQVNVTASDVLHAWAVPAFGVKVDAVPGRLNTTWFQATQTGIFYGQCSELCGKDHSYMPIAVRVVEQAEYDAWLAAIAAEQDYVPVASVIGAEEEAPIQVAAR